MRTILLVTTLLTALTACTLPAPQRTPATHRASLEWMQRQQFRADQRFENMLQQQHRQREWLQRPRP